MKLKTNIDLHAFMTRSTAFFMNGVAPSIIHTGLDAMSGEQFSRTNDLIRTLLLRNNDRAEVAESFELWQKSLQILKFKIAINAIGKIHDNHLEMYKLLEEVVDFDEKEKEMFRESVELGLNAFLDVYNIGSKMHDGIDLTKGEQEILDKYNAIYKKVQENQRS